VTPDVWLRNSLLPVVVILLGSFLLARAAHWIGGRYRVGVDHSMKVLIESGRPAPEGMKRARVVSEAVEWVVVALTFFVSVIVSLDKLGVPLTTLVAPATVAGVALGFGAQQMVGDLLAGFFLFAEHQFGFGDVIRLSMPGQPVGITGTVEELTLRVTRVRNAQGELVTIPNSALRQVTNLSKDWSRAVVDVPIPVDEDLGKVTRVLREMMAGLAADEHWSGLLLGEPLVAGVETIEVGYVQLRLIARTLPGRQFEVGRELRYRAATALRAEGISSPTIDGAAPEAR